MQDLAGVLTRMLSADSSERMRTDGKQLVNAINSTLRRHKQSDAEEMRAVLQDRDNAVLQVTALCCITSSLSRAIYSAVLRRFPCRENDLCVVFVQSKRFEAEMLRLQREMTSQETSDPDELQTLQVSTSTSRVVFVYLF